MIIPDESLERTGRASSPPANALHGYTGDNEAQRYN